MIRIKSSTLNQRLIHPLTDDAVVLSLIKVWKGGVSSCKAIKRKKKKNDINLTKIESYIENQNLCRPLPEDKLSFWKAIKKTKLTCSLNYLTNLQYWQKCRYEHLVTFFNIYNDFQIFFSIIKRLKFSYQIPLQNELNGPRSEVALDPLFN
mgnify:CR=1 FL=1